MKFQHNFKKPKKNRNRKRNHNNIPSSVISIPHSINISSKKNLYIDYKFNFKYNPFWSMYLENFNLPDSYFQNIPQHSKKYCVIVEPRIHQYLIPTIQNYMHLLQHKGWGLIIFHGSHNASYLHESLKNWKHVHFINLGVPNLTIPLYNKLFTSLEFWYILHHHFGCKYALIFQTDSLLLKDNVDDFLQYDYIGAPWPRSFKNVFVGNGGLSLRNVKKMIIILKKIPYNHMNEDVYFCNSAKRLHLNIPNREVAMRFSVERFYYGNHIPTGVHKPKLEYLRHFFTYLKQTSSSS